MTRRTLLRHSPPRRRPAPVVVERLGIDKLNPLVRRKAMQLARGDVSRVQVVNPETAVVR